MTCDGTCLRWSEDGKPEPRAYPLERLCCAMALIRITPGKCRPGLMRVVEIQIGQAHADSIRRAWREARSEG